MHDPNFPPNLSIQPSVSASYPSESLAFNQELGIKKYGIAGRVWEAAYTLAIYTTSPTFDSADSNPEYGGSPVPEFDPPCSLFYENIRPITVVEIGSGTGYAGIHVAHQLGTFHRKRNPHLVDTNVILTDLESVVPQLEVGVGEHAGAIGAGIRTEARVLEWGNQEHADALAEELRKSEVLVTHVLCSDLVYFPHLYPQLLRTLLALTSPPFCGTSSSPELIIGYKVRSLVKEVPFWQVFGTWFSFTPVLARERRIDETEVTWSRFGRATDTHVFVASRRPESYNWDTPTGNSQLMNGFGPIPPRLDDTFECLLLLGMDGDE